MKETIMPDMTIADYQKAVDDWVKTFGVQLQ